MKRTAIVAAALLVLGAAVFILVGEPAPRARAASTVAVPRGETKSPRRGFRLDAGAVQKHALELETIVAAGEERTTARLVGTLTWTGIALGLAHVSFDGQASLALGEKRLTATQGSPLAKALARGVDVELAADGRVRGLHGDVEPGSTADRFLRVILGATQFAVPSGTKADWTVEEDDPSGPSLARYDVREAGRVLALTKFRGPRARGAETKGTFIARFDDSAGALLSLAGVEITTVRVEKTVVSTTTIDLKMNLVERTTVAAAPAPSAAPARSLEEKTAVDPSERDRLLVRNETARSLLERAAKAEESEERSDVIARLAALIRLQPSAARATLERILATKPGAALEAVLLVALGAAGTPEAEGALVAAIEARRNEPETLLQALPAIARISEPSPRAEQLLRELRHDALLPREVTDSALLALGTAAYGLRTRAPARAAAIASEIARELGGSDDELVLLALGNAGTEETLSVVEPLLDRSKPARTRAAAARALRNIEGPRADAVRALAAGRE